MTFVANSMTSANPAADLYADLASALTTAGFTSVDTVTISTRTHEVWKSAAADNSQGLDWYLDVAYTTTGNGAVWLGGFEYYDSATHLGYRGPYNVYNDTTAGDGTYFARYGNTGYALETNWTTITNNIARVPVQTTAYAYWMSVTTDRVIVMSSVGPSQVFYCGFFDMYTPWANKIGADAYPLITCTVNKPNTSTNGLHNDTGNMPVQPTPNGNSFPASLTRKPPSAANPSGFSTEWCPRIYEDFNSLSITTGEPAAGIGAPAGYVDAPAPTYYDAAQGGLFQIVMLYDSQVSVTIGTLSDLALFGGSAVTRGDTISISGTDWVLSTIVSNRCYGFKAI